MAPSTTPHLPLATLPWLLVSKIVPKIDTFTNSVSKSAIQYCDNTTERTSGLLNVFLFSLPLASCL